MKAKIKTALVYPIIMCVVGAGVLLFLISYVVPMVTHIFDRMNQQLPMPTQILMAITNFVNSYLFIIAISLGLAIFAFSRWVKNNPKGRQFWDRFVLRSPLFGSLYQMVLISRFAKIMGTLLRSGVHMLQSLVVVSSTMKNSIVSDAVINMSKMVERGADLSMALRETADLPFLCRRHGVRGRIERQSGGDARERLGILRDKRKSENSGFHFHGGAFDHRHPWGGRGVCPRLDNAAALRDEQGVGKMTMQGGTHARQQKNDGTGGVLPSSS